MNDAHMDDPGTPDLGQARMMENLYWWGIPTMFRTPHAGPEGQDIALVGEI